MLYPFTRFCAWQENNNSPSFPFKPELAIVISSVFLKNCSNYEALFDWLYSYLGFVTIQVNETA